MAKDSKKEALAEYKKARRALTSYKPKHEDAKFRRLNSAVIKAEKNVPWWRR